MQTHLEEGQGQQQQNNEGETSSNNKRQKVDQVAANICKVVDAEGQSDDEEMDLNDIAEYME